jgi:hypothetical protein
VTAHIRCILASFATFDVSHGFLPDLGRALPKAAKPEAWDRRIDINSLNKLYFGWLYPIE